MSTGLCLCHKSPKSSCPVDISILIGYRGEKVRKVGRVMAPYSDFILLPLISERCLGARLGVVGGVEAGEISWVCMNIPVE